MSHTTTQINCLILGCSLPTLSSCTRNYLSYIWPRTLILGSMLDSLQLEYLLENPRITLKRKLVAILPFIMHSELLKKMTGNGGFWSTLIPEKMLGCLSRNISNPKSLALMLDWAGLLEEDGKKGMFTVDTKIKERKHLYLPSKNYRNFNELGHGLDRLTDKEPSYYSGKVSLKKKSLVFLTAIKVSLVVSYRAITQHNHNIRKDG